MEPKEQKIAPTINACIIDFENGTNYFNDVQVIRLHSEDYRVMIMSDHTPMIGELNGDILILKDDEEVVIEHVHGFYMHLNNHFRFIQSGIEVTKEM